MLKVVVVGPIITFLYLFTIKETDKGSEKNSIMRRLSVIVILIFEQLAQLRTLHFQILAALAALILGAIWVCNNPQTWCKLSSSWI